VRTSICLVFTSYLTIAGTPSIMEDPSVIIALVALTAFALFIFAVPLVSAHRSMEEEKRRLLDENGQTMESVISETHRRWEVGDLSGIDNLKDMLDNLVTEQQVLGKISTWPWQVGTVGVLVTALVLPIFLWLVQRILERLLAF
jgi:hypothetical protein